MSSQCPMCGQIVPYGSDADNRVIDIIDPVFGESKKQKVIDAVKAMKIHKDSGLTHRGLGYNKAIDDVIALLESKL